METVKAILIWRGNIYISIEEDMEKKDLFIVISIYIGYCNGWTNISIQLRKNCNQITMYLNSKNRMWGYHVYIDDNILPKTVWFRF